MAKKVYVSPLFLMSASDEEISIGGSQGTSGYDSPYSFSGISDDDLAMIEANCDDFDLQAMDNDGDYEITQAEFQAWYDANQPW